ncbi:N-terminal domain of NEFA-interacting nuclear protein NIP30-domain-containing protein [Xylaria cf. heliscus]|nr:N-terminal domain of NEFA-interacting nuclear protein NIP30-domain-containing protein [Xylaria cf. heliscus]
MTSRFVSGGTIAGDDGGTSAPPPSTSVKGEGERQGDVKKNSLSVEWEAVQKDLDEERRRRESARRANVEGGGGERSLYEVLQANKASKQAAFEEQNRIRNQFRALDDDEIEFLHGVSDERRAEEDRVRRETEEGLADFREKQRATAGGGEDAAGGGGDEIGDNEWENAAAGRKRKREKEREKGVLKGVKRRTSMGAKEKEEGKGVDDPGRDVGGDRAKSKSTTESAAPKEATTVPTLAQTAGTQKPKPKPALGLVDYGSDEDDD